MTHTSGRAAVNGVELYYEIHGEGSPLVMLHGGVNPSAFFGAPLAEMARTHQVIAIHLRGHGLSSDTDAPWSTELFADDVAALIRTLGFEQVDVMGWSMGGAVTFQMAIRHPELVRKLVVISLGVRSEGNFPEVQAQFEAMPALAVEFAPQLAQSPLAALYPDVNWESLMRKTGAMLNERYDWSSDVARIAAPVLLVYSDADMLPLESMAEVYRLLGGGTRDAGLDGSLRPSRSQLAIIPGTTHYNLPIVATACLATFVNAFLAD